MKRIQLLFFTGVLLSTLWGNALYSAPPKIKLSLEQATAIATKEVPGTVKSAEFGHEMDQDIYGFDILASDTVIHEILVDANTGEIISNTIGSKDYFAF